MSGNLEELNSMDNTKNNSEMSVSSVSKTKPNINDNIDNQGSLSPLHNEIEKKLIGNNENKGTIDVNHSGVPEVVVINPENGNESTNLIPSSTTLDGQNKEGYYPASEKQRFSTPGFDNKKASTLGSTKIPDVNVYQHKKTLAQGMMDLSLFSANTNQLRYVLENFAKHPFYYPSVILICLSLLLQVGIGVGLIWNATYNVKDDKEICVANKINNFTIIGIFLVTVINVFISVFGVSDPV